MRYLLLAVLIALPSAPAWARAGGGGGGGGGGCFAAGTIVATTAGGLPIEDVRRGDMVLAYSESGLMQVPVQNFIKERSRLLTLTASNKAVLRTTNEHPLLTRGGFVEAGKLKRGEEIGVMHNGRLAWVKIKKVKYGGETDVYNLEVAPPHTFIADGFIAHNKGGGGYSYRSGRSRSGKGGISDISTFMTLALVVMVMLVRTKERFFDKGTPERLFSRQNVETRAAETRAIMESLASADPAMRPAGLEAMVKESFLAVQAAWQARDYSTLRGRLAPELYAGHSAKVESLRARGEINMMEDVTVSSLDFVHVRFPADPAARSFTALITASARDYTIGEVNHNPLRGSRDLKTFQEFWTFGRFNGNWAPARINQTTDDYILTAPNLPAAPLRPGAAAAGPAFAAAAQALPIAAAGLFAQPAIPAQEKPRRFDSSGDPWDKQKMEIAATLAFQNVYGAWEKGRPEELQLDGLLPEAAAKLKKMMASAAGEKLSFEFKDLYTRKAEIVLTSRAAKNVSRMDEFAARINASAARALSREGKSLHRDAAPQPFTEYWVFARSGDKWKFSEILPRMKQEGGEDCQADVAPTPVQLEWYWQS